MPASGVISKAITFKAGVTFPALCDRPQIEIAKRSDWFIGISAFNMIGRAKTSARATSKKLLLIYEIFHPSGFT